ncbi:MAG: hypothetical protein BIFFINMI_01247 [Phycisphaerae bacterium]|nr:hypothetical protein [Phycisphaerae bacterium]
MKRARLHHRLVSLIGLAMFLVTIYLSVVVLCLVRINAADPAQPAEDSPAWRVLSTISPISHVQKCGKWVGAIDRNSENYLRSRCRIWPWEQLAVEQEDTTLTINVVATTESRAQRIARQVREELDKGAGQLGQGGNPALLPR